MRNTFRGFYSLNDEKLIKDIWNSSKTIFIFDTNCLLNLYRCEDNTRHDILSVMTKISENVWLPFFVCLEYQKNRRTVITESIDNLCSIRQNLNGAVTKVTDSLGVGKVKKHLYNSLSEGIYNLQAEIKPFVDKFILEHIETRISSKKEIDKRDTIREAIDKLFIGKCGIPPTPEWIKEINSIGEHRFSKLIPPGFSDATKDKKKLFLNLEFEDKFGDLYIWREIIDKCKDDNIENVVFVCDDNKKDWWYKPNGTVHGPLEALQTEIYSESKIQNFKLINQATFLNDAQSYLPDININVKSLQEVKEISEVQKEIIKNTSKNLFAKILKEKNYKLFANNYSMAENPDIINEIIHYDKTPITSNAIEDLLERIIFNLKKLKVTHNDFNKISTTAPRSLHDYAKRMPPLSAALWNYWQELTAYMVDIHENPNGQALVRSSLLSIIHGALKESDEIINSLESYLESH
ncbi:PIN-like domain-containing protein [Serratia fonticola]|uniref:PIN-like domain-containing protein n=1 Tax=Serratia fonticola TaxID=47917 RepID=UPI0034C6540D